MRKFQSIKLFSGYSTCFRQWAAVGTHCKFLHGYGVSFECTFEGELDHRNWVLDFGFAKRSLHRIKGRTPDEYFKWLLDHTVIIAKDDPEIDKFHEMAMRGIIQLRVLEKVGCEIFANHILEVMNKFLLLETDGKVQCIQVRFFENEKNSAIAILENQK